MSKLIGSKKIMISFPWVQKLMACSFPLNAGNLLIDGEKVTIFFDA